MADAENSEFADRGAVETLKICVTASEAFPELERLFLSARREIHAGFRVFDLTTKLRSDEGRKIGHDWFDLFVHVLGKGVSISLTLTDFDPVVATEYHRKSWTSARQLAGAGEVSGQGRLSFRIDTHGARVGIVPRMVLRPKVRGKFEEADPDPTTPGLEGVRADDVFELIPATHHHKLAVFDRETLYIGGLDLDERRFDDHGHDRAPEETWQDVQVVVTGPVVAAAQTHLETFAAVARGDADVAPGASGFLRTISRKRRVAPLHISPKPLVNEIEEKHLEAIGRSEDLIFLETQFFRHRPLAEALARRAAEVDALHLICVLPAAPETVAFEGSEGEDARMGEYLQAEVIDILSESFGQRAVFCAPVQKRRAEAIEGRAALAGSPIIYVHSKVSIFDTTEGIVSSANLNGRSLRWDTEAGVHLTDAGHVRLLRARMFGKWMPGLSEATRTAELLASWREAAQANAQTSPEERPLFLVPYDNEAARAFGKGIWYVPDELV